MVRAIPLDEDAPQGGRDLVRVMGKCKAVLNECPDCQYLEHPDHPQILFIMLQGDFYLFAIGMPEELPFSTREELRRWKYAAQCEHRVQYVADSVELRALIYV